MRIDYATLDKAIEHYASNLSRHWWLDPQWRDLQHDAWRLLIDQHKTTPGKLIINDFAAAIHQLLVGTGAGHSPNGSPILPKAASAIVPPMIVDAAVAIAAARHDRARMSVEQHDDFWLIVERNRLKAAVDRASDADSVEAMNAAVVEAVTRFQMEAREVRETLVNSGYDVEVVTEKLAVIDQRESEAITRVAERPPQLVTARQEMPSLQEVQDRMMRPDW